MLESSFIHVFKFIYIYIYVYLHVYAAHNHICMLLLDFCHSLGFAMASASSNAGGSQPPPEPEGLPPLMPGYGDSRLKRPRDEDLARSAERRMEHVLGKAASPPDSLEAQFALMLTKKSGSSGVELQYPEAAYCGLYIRIHMMWNGKSLFKSQELGAVLSPLSPERTAYLWFSKSYQIWFLSERPVDEMQGAPSVIDWELIKVLGMFSPNLKEVYMPWNSAQEHPSLQWQSYFWWSLDKINRIYQAPGDEDPPEVVGTRSIDAAELVAAHGWMINPPPAPVLPPVRKTGYFAKLIAFMAALDMSMTPRALRVRDFILRNPTFKRFYEDHVEQLTRFGEDPRYDYV